MQVVAKPELLQSKPSVSHSCTNCVQLMQGLSAEAGGRAEQRAFQQVRCPGEGAGVQMWPLGFTALKPNITNIRLLI